MLEINGTVGWSQVSDIYTVVVNGTTSTLVDIAKATMRMIDFSSTQASKVVEGEVEQISPSNDLFSLVRLGLLTGVVGIVIAGFVWPKREWFTKNKPSPLDQHTSALSHFFSPKLRPHLNVFGSCLHQKSEALQAVISRLPIQGTIEVDLLAIQSIIGRLKGKNRDIEPLQKDVLTAKENFVAYLNNLDSRYLAQIGILEGEEKSVKVEKPNQPRISIDMDVREQDDITVLSEKISRILEAFKAQERIIKEMIENLNQLFSDYQPMKYEQGLVDINDLLDYLNQSLHRMSVIQTEMKKQLDSEETKREENRTLQPILLEKYNVAKELANNAATLLEGSKEDCLTPESHQTFLSLYERKLKDLEDSKEGDAKKDFSVSLCLLICLLGNDGEIQGVYFKEAIDQLGRLLDKYLASNEEKRPDLSDNLLAIQDVCCKGLKEIIVGEKALDGALQSKIQNYILILASIYKLDKESFNRFEKTIPQDKEFNPSRRILEILSNLERSKTPTSSCSIS